MIRIPVSRYVSASALALTLAMPAALSPMLASPAHAFGFGRIVYDPTNYAQNVLLTAARTLEQINNQITSLQNEAQMLINQAQSREPAIFLAPDSCSRTSSARSSFWPRRRTSPSTCRRSIRCSSRNTARSRCRDRRPARRRCALRWQNTVGGLQDAMRVQAGVVGNIDTNRAEMSRWSARARTRPARLQATQAGNQLLALQSQQLSDLIALMSRQRPLRSADEAERHRRRTGPHQRERFLTPGIGLQPGNARMFGNGNN
jgi:conjugal transfer/entry exclusion protein